LSQPLYSGRYCPLSRFCIVGSFLPAYLWLFLR
jgi:hypothetical protein